MAQMSVSSIGYYKELIPVFSTDQAERLDRVLTSIVEQVKKDERFRQRESLDRVEATLEHIAQIQASTEEALKQLISAQTRTEGRVGHLAQAQAHTEERVGRLEEAVERLAQAQARTEEHVGRLEEAQVRTEAAIQTLTQAVTGLQKQVGALSDSIGLGLEDIGYAILPAYIESIYGIREITFTRRFIQVSGQQIEVNLYAEGKRDGEKVILIGEAKNRIKRAEVRKFTKRLRLLKKVLDEPLFPFMFGFWIHPSAEELAVEHDMELIVSYKLTR